MHLQTSTAGPSETPATPPITENRPGEGQPRLSSPFAGELRVLGGASDPYLEWGLSGSTDRKSRSKSARERVWRGEAFGADLRGTGSGPVPSACPEVSFPGQRRRLFRCYCLEAGGLLERERRLSRNPSGAEPPSPFRSPGRWNRPLIPHLRSCVALALPKSVSHGKRARGSPCWTQGRGGGREHLQREVGHAGAPPLGLGGGFSPTGRAGAGLSPPRSGTLKRSVARSPKENATARWVSLRERRGGSPARTLLAFWTGGGRARSADAPWHVGRRRISFLERFQAGFRKRRLAGTVTGLHGRIGDEEGPVAAAGGGGGRGRQRGPGKSELQTC